MKLQKKPYLIAPKLYEQPTWGGSLIGEHKGWQDRPDVKGKKIGQSYELYDGTQIVEMTDSSLPEFGPEGAVTGYSLAQLARGNEKNIFGPNVVDAQKERLLLIKFTQAMGNSFQLHVRMDRETARWKAKPESWYFLKAGAVTLGVNKDTKVADYKACCVWIDAYMHELSDQVQKGTLSLSDAKAKAGAFITKENPHQYVNFHIVPEHTLVDLSGGELHHSWQEYEPQPWGNYVYEVQRDVKDDYCTLRSFDQGKFKDDGTVRTLTIEDYFANINPDPAYNELSGHLITPTGENLMKSDFYSLDELHLSTKREMNVGGSYDHLWVREGTVEVVGPGGAVTLTAGHSAFVPWDVATYSIVPISAKAVLLRTYV